MRSHPFPPLQLSLIDSPVCCATYYVGASLRQLAAEEAHASAKRYRCALCHRDLAKAKGKLHNHQKGKICQNCFNRTRRSPSTPAVAAEPKRSHKRTRGELPAHAQRQRMQSRPMTRRILSSNAASSPLPNKRSFVPTDVSSLLDQTHQRRLSLLAAESNAPSCHTDKNCNLDR